MIVDLSKAEMLALSLEMEHSPNCVWSEQIPAHVFVRDENGLVWTDETCTVPYVEPEFPPCTCGYFALLDSARDKLRAAAA